MDPPLCIWLFSVYTSNGSAGILDLWFWCNIVETIPFPYMMEHLLQLLCEASYIFFQSMTTINLCCCHNVFFLVYVEVSCSSNFIFDCCKHNHLSNYFNIYISNCHDIPQVFQRRKFQWRENVIKGSYKGEMWYNKLLKNIRLTWTQPFFHRLFGSPIWCLTGVEVMGDRDGIWPIWISVSDYGILSKECPVLISRIFLFETLYLDAAVRRVDVPWTTDITVLKRSWLTFHGIDEM